MLCTRLILHRDFFPLIQMSACGVRRSVRGDSIPGPTLATLWLEFDVTLLRTDILSAPIVPLVTLG